LSRRSAGGDGAPENGRPLRFGAEGLIVEAERGREQELLWLRDAAKCARDVCAVQVQPKEAGEGLRVGPSGVCWYLWNI
jgi:hypothetical protein